MATEAPEPYCQITIRTKNVDAVQEFLDAINNGIDDGTINNKFEWAAESIQPFATELKEDDNG